MALQPNLGYIGLGNPTSSKGSSFFNPANVFDFDNLGSAQAVKNINIAHQQGTVPKPVTPQGPKMTSLKEMETNVRNDLLAKNPDMAALKQQVDQKQKYMIDYARKSFGLPTSVTDDKILKVLMDKKPEIIDQFFAQDFANLKEIRGRTGALLGAQALPDNLFNRVVTKPVADVADLLYRGVYGTIDNANAGIANAFGRDFEKTTDLNTQDSLAALAGGVSNTFGLMAAPWLNLGLGLAQETEPGRQIVEGTIGKVVSGIQESSPFQSVFGGSPDRFQQNAAGFALDLISPGVEALPGRAKNLIKKAGTTIDKITGDVPTRNVGPDITTAIRPSVASTKVGGLENWETRATEAFKDIVARKDIIKIDDELANRSPENLKELAEAIPQVKKDIYDEYTSRAEALGDSVKIDYTPVVNELTNALEKAKVWETVVPGITKYIEGRIQEFKQITEQGLHSVKNAQDLKQILNAKLQSYFKNPNPNDIGTNTVDAMINNIMGEVLDDTIEKGLGDGGYGELKKSYGNLRAIEKDVKHRATVDARKSKSGFFDLSDVFTAAELAQAITSLSTASLGKAAVMYGVKEFLKSRNDPNRRIRRIFKTLDQQVQPYDRSITKGLVERANEFATQKVKEEAKPTKKKIGQKENTSPVKKGTKKEEVKGPIKEAVKKKYQRAVEDSPITKEEAESIVRKYFTKDEVGTAFVDALTTPDKAQAFGAYADAMILFAKDPMASTPEHEVVHAYMDMFSPNRDVVIFSVINKHLDEVNAIKKQLGIEDTREAAEEWLADNFVQYVQNRKTFTGVLKQFFENLWNNVKKVFGQEDKILSLYNDIIDRKRPQKAAPSEIATSKFMADGERLSTNDAKNNLSVKFLESINKEIKKDVIGAQYLENYAKRPELKKPERRIIEDILKAMPGDSISKSDFMIAVKSELLDLNIKETAKWSDYNSLRDQEGYSIDSRMTNIYEAPFVVSEEAATHFGSESDSYFAHSRYEDIGDTRRILEIQSDLFQRKRYENEINETVKEEVAPIVEEIKKKRIENQEIDENIERIGKEKGRYRKMYDDYVAANEKAAEMRSKAIDDEGKPNGKYDMYNELAMKASDKASSLEIELADAIGISNIGMWDIRRVSSFDELFDLAIKSLENRRANNDFELKGDYAKRDKAILGFPKKEQRLNDYANTWYERVIREEISKAAKDGKEIVQFPMPDAISRIEGYSEGNTIPRGQSLGNRLDINGYEYIVTGLDSYDDQVTAIPYDRVERVFDFDSLLDEEVTYWVDMMKDGDDSRMLEDFIIQHTDALDPEWMHQYGGDSDVVKMQKYMEEENWAGMAEDETMRDAIWNNMESKMREFAQEFIEKNQFTDAEEYVNYMRDSSGVENLFADDDGKIYQTDGDWRDYQETFKEGEESAGREDPNNTDWIQEMENEDQRAVVEFYQRKLIPYIKKLRKDATIEFEDGVNWLNVPLTPEDATAPVMAYQRGKNLIRKKK